MANPQAAESRELALIDKVEFRIALAEDDVKLQSTLNTYLTPLLLKLASEHVSVRNKVITVCQHINTRTSPDNIQLPVAALIKQFKDHSDNQLIRHFDINYIQRGFPRLPEAERAKLLPVFASNISDISSAPPAQAGVIFYLFIQSLIVYPLPPKESPEDDQLRSTIDLSDDDAKYLIHWMGKLILFKSANTSSSTTGLNTQELEFLSLQAKEGVWNTSSLMQAKYTCLRFMGSRAFNDTERLMPVLLASADSNARISGLAEDILKLTLPEVDMNDKSLVQKLFDLYLRSDHLDNETISSSAALRIKVLGLLSKTSTSALFVDQIKNIVTRDLVQNTVSQGRELTKLRISIVQLLISVARSAKATEFKNISRDILSSMKDFLDQQHNSRDSTELTDLRCRSFEVVGIIISTDEGIIVDPDLSTLRWLYQSLKEEKNKQVVFNIDEAISRAIQPLQKHATPIILQSLRAWLEECINQEMDPSTDSLNSRNLFHTVARFANRCLPFSDITARSIDVKILTLPNPQTHEIVEEASKGLDPYWSSLVQFRKSDIEPPDFCKISKVLLADPEGRATVGSSPAIAIKFCRRCLFWSCLYEVSGKLEATVDWENKMDVALTQDHEVRTQVCQTLRKQQDTKVWDYVELLFHRAVECFNTAHQNQADVINIIHELVTLIPDHLLDRLAPGFDEIRPGVFTNELQPRMLAAQSFGILASRMTTDNNQVEKALSFLLQRVDIVTNAIGVESNRAHGSLIALAYFSSRRKLREPEDPIAQNVIARVSPPKLVNWLATSDTTLQDAALRSFSQLCIFNSVHAQDVEEEIGLSAAFEKVAELAKEGKDAAIFALGHMSIMLDENEHEAILDTLLEKVRQLHEIRQPETQFSVGESLASIGAAWRSTAMLQQKNVDWPVPQSPDRSRTLPKIVQKVLEDSKTTKPALKKASVIWLLCLLQFCGDQGATQERLPQFQVAFKRCLSDKDELVQESASRGLGLVYERGSRELKDDLVRDLISSFSSNRADLSGAVTQDTELFEPGALPTGDGSVTTYKDIMSLASEVGDPSLVYRFMSLASNNAIWSNRAAFGRFGLSNVLSDSSVDGYLSNNPKMYSALYRYRFDPNSNVRRSMNDIWNALVKDPTNTINDHFNMICNDLLDQMISREWRARQASCTAMADILQGRKLTQIQPYLDRTWSQCFKVLDDIKESVRSAAADLARVLTNILLRNLEGNEGKTEVIGDLLKSVIPFILSPSGLESSAKEVQMLSLHTLLEIIKKAKPVNLRPFIPDLISELLSLLTSFEPEIVNYVALNAQKYNLSQNEIDDARLKSIRSSPIMEAIERALDLLDDQTMATTAPKLRDVMRSAVGEPSKVGSSRVLVSLSTRKNFIFRPYADEFMRALEKRIMDRNDTVSSAYAVSTGYVARLASDEQILNTITYCKGMYFGDDGDSRPRYIAGEVLQGIARHATDRFHSLASDAIPIIFFGRFDDTANVREIFQETYNDTVPGSRAVSLYLSEIVSLSKSQLLSPKWTFKHAAAKALAEAAEILGSSHGGINTRQAEEMWTPLKTALAEKSWDGKERVLEGFIVYVEKSHEFWRRHVEARTETKKIVLREAQRRNRNYQVHALTCLGKVAAAMHDEDMLQEVHGIAQRILKEEGTDAMELDDKAHDETRFKLLAKAIEAVFAAMQLQHHREHTEDLLARSSLGLDCIQTALNLPLTTSASTIQSQTSAFFSTIFASFRCLFNSLRFDAEPNTPSLSHLATAARSGDPLPFLGRTIELISSNKGIMQERPRHLRAEAILALTDIFPFSSPDLNRFSVDLASRLDLLVEQEKSLPIRHLLADTRRRVLN